MPEQVTDTRALFPGLVYNEQGEPAEVAFIGGVAHYAIPDAGFMRHVEAQRVDDAVLAHFQEQIAPQREMLVDTMLKMMGKEDIFTRAAVDAQLRNFAQSVRQTQPEQWVPWLRLLGFRIVVDVHGNVVEIIYPEESADEGE